MSYVIHDRRGYLCDLASAYAYSGVMNWLDGIEHSPLVTEFLFKGRATHTQKLAGEIERLLLAHPPNADVTDVAKVMIRAFRRAQGYPPPLLVSLGLILVILKPVSGQVTP